MSPSKSKCWYSNNRLHFLKRAVPLVFGHVDFWLVRSQDVRAEVVVAKSGQGVSGAKTI